MKFDPDPTPRRPPTPAESREIESILLHFGGGEDRERVYSLLNGQLSLIYGRASSLVQVASVVITVTGFSGRIIADTSTLAQVLVIGGVSMVSLAAASALVFVLPVKWITATMHLPLRAWMLVVLRRRDAKVRAIKFATGLLIIGMVLYIAAIGLMLADPAAAELTRVR